MMSWIDRWLRRNFFHKEIGWTEIGEEFTRFTLLKTRWFTIYLHKLDAPQWHPECHDHPWHFWTLILWGGYWESSKQGLHWRGPGRILYRTAKFQHNVVTKGVGWSIILTSHKKRDWGFMKCGVDERLLPKGDSHE
jgi:hypothetical protein